MKSKYIESDMNNSIEKVQKQVNDGKKVLFCGTPCQVKGLKEAIKDSNGNLLTCDFICHGVPSSLVFKDYLESFYGKDEVTEIDFRPKSIGWSKKNIIIKTKKKVINKPYYLDYYYRGFMKENIFLRRACYRCKFRKKHYSDITIADFWGYKDLDIKLNNEKGLSLIITNTEIGNTQCRICSK